MKKDEQIKKLKEFFKKNFQIDDDKIDYFAEVDSKLTYPENKRNLLEMIGKGTSILKDMKGLELQAKIQGNEREEENAKQELTIAIDKAIANSQAHPEIEKHFTTAKEYVNMVAEGYNNSLILLGKGGIGKTHLVVRTLREKKVDYVLLNSYSTPLSFYKFLYEHNGKVIVLDDFDNILANDIGISILKSALWSAVETRAIYYLSTSKHANDVPASFVFTGRIIFCLNQIPHDAELKALITRCLFYEINFSFTELIEIMLEIAKVPYKKTELDERMKVAQYIAQHSNATTKEMNFRTLIKAFDIFLYCKDHKLKWQPLVHDLLQNDEDMELVAELGRKFGEVSKQAQEFTEMTGKSRATFFRLKKSLKVSQEKQMRHETGE